MILIHRGTDGSFEAVMIKALLCRHGGQYAICIPEKAMILIYNGDNHGKACAGNCIFDNFFNLIVNGNMQQAGTCERVFIINMQRIF